MVDRTEAKIWIKLQSQSNCDWKSSFTVKKKFMCCQLSLFKIRCSDYSSIIYMSNLTLIFDLTPTIPKKISSNCFPIFNPNLSLVSYKNKQHFCLCRYNRTIPAYLSGWILYFKLQLHVSENLLLQTFHFTISNCSM